MASEAGAKGVVTQHEGVGDPFTYRKRAGRFSASEWAVQIVLPVLVVLLGARPLFSPSTSVTPLFPYVQHLSPLHSMEPCSLGPQRRAARVRCWARAQSQGFSALLPHLS